MTKEALRFALEALENLPALSWIPEKDNQVQEAITAIKEALAQPEQKSVAMADYMALTDKYVALKAAQRTWAGLTDEEILVKCESVPDYDIGNYDLIQFARAIETKLKEKNT